MSSSNAVNLMGRGYLAVESDVKCAGVRFLNPLQKR
jgi:hypothetical protein